MNSYKSQTSRAIDRQNRQDRQDRQDRQNRQDQQHELTSLQKELCIVKSECVYTSCYCEENIWKLCDLIRISFPFQLSNCHVIFISNPNESIPLWCQRAGDHTNGHLAIWDYHVIMIYKSSNSSPCQEQTMVYDFDSTLAFPTPFDQYSSSTFRDEQSLKQKYYRMFRVISAQEYLAKFASDRSRMKSADGMSWLKPPPDYECIKTSQCDNNLEEFISMIHDSSSPPSKSLGNVINFKEFMLRFSDECDRDRNEELTL